MSDHLWRFVFVPFVPTDDYQEVGLRIGLLRRKLIPINPPSSFGSGCETGRKAGFSVYGALGPGSQRGVP